MTLALPPIPCFSKSLCLLFGELKHIGGWVLSEQEEEEKMEKKKGK